MDELIQAAKRRDDLKLLWTLFSSPELKQALFEWREWSRIHRN